MMIRADVYHAVSNCRRGFNVVSGRYNPESVARTGIEGVELGGIEAGKDNAVSDCWGRRNHVAEGGSPAYLAGTGIKGVKFVGAGTDVDHLTANSGWSIDLTAGRDAPVLL